MMTDLVGYRVEDRDEVTHVLEGEDWVEHFALASVVFSWELDGQVVSVSRLLPRFGRT